MVIADKIKHRYHAKKQDQFFTLTDADEFKNSIEIPLFLS
jgi:hypothetical protein